MVVCSCNAVTNRTIDAAICAGAETIDQLAAMCKAGSRCGGCWPELNRLLAAAGCGESELVAPATVGKTRSVHAA